MKMLRSMLVRRTERETLRRGITDTRKSYIPLLTLAELVLQNKAVRCPASLGPMVATDGIEPSTFRFSVGGITVTGFHYDSVSIELLGSSLFYDPLRKEV